MLNLVANMSLLLQYLWKYYLKYFHINTTSNFYWIWILVDTEALRIMDRSTYLWPMLRDVT